MGGQEKSAGNGNGFHLYNRLGLVILDALCIALAFFSAYALRFEFFTHDEFVSFYSKQLFNVVPLVTVIGLRLILYGLFGLYRSIRLYASLNEAISLAMSTLIGTLLLVSINLGLQYLPQIAGLPLLKGSTAMARIPWPVVVMEGILSFLLVGGNRLWPRLYILFLSSKRPGEKRVIVIGANTEGVNAARALAGNPLSGFRPVGFIDDNAALWGRRIDAIPVLGDINTLPEAIEQTNAEEILIALPDAAPRDLRTIMKECEKARLRFRRVPSVGEVMNGRVTVNELRPVEIEDLLGRPPVELKLDPEKNYLRGKTVLVTGAGGSIGSEICRQAMQYEPGQLIILGRGENSIYEIATEFRYDFKSEKIRLIIGNICDDVKMEKLFSKFRPHVVFHTAAHKHVPLMELHPDEAVKNNFFGTQTLARLADRFGAEHFIHISTDKAVRPTNVMGASKRMAEMVIQRQSAESKTAFHVVRFGNVLGSRGSVIPLLKRQVMQGGPVTVTHADALRYFMTIPEAVSLVIQTGSLGCEGQLYLLDMGEPVRILDLARNIITLSGFEPDVDIEITFTGLRPGEKLEEELLTEGEGVGKTELGKVFVANMEPLDFAWFDQQEARLKEALASADNQAIMDILKDMVPEYNANP